MKEKIKILKTRLLNLVTYIILSIIIIIVGAITLPKGNIINQIRPGFYFEKYRTTEEAKAELLKLYPIGSDIEPLVERFNKIKCSIKKIDQYTLDKARKINSRYKEVDEIINCTTNTGFLSFVEWRVSVTVKNKKISNIEIGKEYTGL